MYEQWSLSFKSENESHSFEVQELTNETAKIEVSSEPQEYTFSVGEEKKFELSGDNYYDLYVKLNSINTYYSQHRANITIQTIHELIPEEKEPVISEVIKNITNEETGSVKLWILISVLVVVVLFLIVLIIYRLKHKRNS